MPNPIVCLCVVVAVVLVVYALRRASSSSNSFSPTRRSSPPYTFVQHEPLKVSYGPPRRNPVAQPAVVTPVYELLVHAAHESDPAVVDRLLLTAVQQAEDPHAKNRSGDLFNARYARSLWLIEQGRFGDAEKLLNRFGRENNDETVLVLCALVTACLEQNKLERAECYAYEVLKRGAEEEYPDVLDVVATLHQLAEAFRRKLRLDDARQVYRRTAKLACLRDKLGVARIIALEKLVECECRQQRWADAALVYNELREEYALQTNRCDKPDLLDRCANMLTQVGRTDEAAELSRRAVDARREQDGQVARQPQPQDRKVLKLKVLPLVSRQQQPQS